jgi:hypothetical protein
MEDKSKTIDLYDRDNPEFIGVNRVNTYTADMPEKYRNKHTAPDSSQRVAHVNPNNSWV